MDATVAGHDELKELHETMWIDRLQRIPVIYSGARADDLEKITKIELIQLAEFYIEQNGILLFELAKKLRDTK